MSRSIDRARNALALLAGVVALVAVAVSVAHATTVTWTNAAGGDWSNAANWSPAVVPATGDAVVLPALGGAYVVNLDADPSLSALTVAAGASLQVVDGDSLRFTGTLIHNDGTIQVGPSVASCLFFADSVHFRGAGEVVLTGDARINNILPKPQAPQRVFIVNEAGHTIRGSGVLYMPVYNHGLLHADGSGTAFLRMQERLENWGTVRATHATFHMNVPAFRSHGGQIVGDAGQFTTIIGLTGNVGGAIDNLDGGSFVADGGDLYVAGGTIADGTVTHTANGGAVHFNGLGNPSGIVVAAGATLIVDGQYDWTVDNSTLENHGTVVVTGLLNVFCQAGAVCNLTGDGTLVLQGGTIACGALGGALHNSAGSTITGCGTITANVINDGTISIDCPTGATTMTDVTLTNRKTVQVLRGGLRVRGSKARITNSGTVTLSGMTYIDQGATVWNTANGKLVSNGTTVLGWRAPGATVVGGTLSGGGSFITSGNVTLNGVTLASDATFTVGAATTTRLSGAAVTSAGTLDIGGTMVADAGVRLSQSGGQVHLNGGTLDVPAGFTVNGALRGTGTVIGNLTDAGEITPDVNATGLRVQGDYHQLAGGRLNLGLAGYGADQFTHLTVTGAAVLDGSVGVTSGAGFEPAPGRTAGVLGAGSLSGQFATVEPPPGLLVQPLYGAAGVALQALPTTGVDGLSSPLTLRFFGLARGFALDLPKAATVSVRTYDVAGREVAVLANGPLAAGSHRFSVATTGLPSGLYFAIATVVTDGRGEVRRARTLLVR
jgi:hypothetical protein